MNVIIFYNNSYSLWWKGYFISQVVCIDQRNEYPVLGDTITCTCTCCCSVGDINHHAKVLYYNQFGNKDVNKISG